MNTQEIYTYLQESMPELEVKQKLIEKWNGQLPTTSLGDNIPILNLN